MTHNVTQQNTKWCAKNTFFGIEHDMILDTLAQHHAQTLNMVSYQNKHSLIIKVDLKKFMYEIFKRRKYYSRKNSKCILESKGHYRILVASPFCYKACFVAVLLFNSELMVVFSPFTHLGHMAEIFKPLGVSLGASLESRLSPCS